MPTPNQTTPDSPKSAARLAYEAIYNPAYGFNAAGFAGFEKGYNAVAAETTRLAEALKEAEVQKERLYGILVEISEETDLRNIRGTIQHALKL